MTWVGNGKAAGSVTDRQTEGKKERRKEKSLRMPVYLLVFQFYFCNKGNVYVGLFLVFN